MTSDDFAEFFKAVHGQEPFPWQRRLARRVVEGDGWPSTIALPTAAGKTAVIDVAVFALACADGNDARRAPRRIFFVIDRRIVVDAAYERAMKLACKLEEARAGRGGVLREVADRLVRLGGAVPLQVAVLRGGMYRDHAWARSPEQPLVCASTVDQVGSRLLFRGYGVRPSMLPVHAALVGNDALIVLDEAHISQPFDETLSALARYRTWADTPIDAPWLSVRMSATPDPAQQGVFREDLDDHHHELLAKRLDASKHAELVPVECEDGGPPHRRQELEQASRGRLVEEAARQARRLRDEDRDARVIAVVVNRVGTARAVFEQLRGEPEADAVLLTGRSRPWDRTRLLEEFLPRMRAGRAREEDRRHLFVVATQSIEVGADLDFDALVTECASLDAVRQRFGRLDRLGERGTTRAVVVARSDHLARGAEDPVYGHALAETWRWLAQKKGAQKKGKRPAAIDMGVTALGSLLPDGEQLKSMCSPPRDAPVLLPAHLDLWVQTSPVPVPDPDVSLFLHGPAQGPADVQLVWRADLPEDDPSLWADIVALAPPSSGESIPVPLHAVREWLKRLPPSDVADVEGALEAEEEHEQQGRRCLRWRGVEDEVIQPDQIAPGDTVVVPATYGGADAFGWHPESTDETVQDIGDAVSLEFRGRPVVRLHASATRSMFPEGDDDRLAALKDSIGSLRSAFEDEELLADRERAILQGLATSELSAKWARRAAKALLSDTRPRRIRYPDDSGIALIGSRRLRPVLAKDEGEQVTDEDDATLFTQPVGLSEHTDGVRQWVERFAQTCVGKPLADDLMLAAELHDFGKVDPRFQVMLHGGDEVAAAMAAEPLAKSGTNPSDRRARRLARERAGCPAGYRHEATSLALLVAQSALLERANDPDLVLHLVASHHGFARPFLPVVHDPTPVHVSYQYKGVAMATSSAHGLERLDSGVADRFWRLVRRYGYYGLAYLEAILRLADHRRSEEEEE